jgi:diguanylate cyclase (GGDEF)-like protein
MFLCTVALLFSLEIRFMQRHLEEENISLSRMANFDALTHLMNRRSMNIQLKQVLDETEIMGEDFCLIMADIDDFKKVNDTYGHSKGDEVLVEVARVLQSNVREQDKVCRWGGEEMLILLRSNMDIAKGVAQRICSDMSQTKIENGENPIYVTLTLGVSAYEKGITIRNMIETADQRMYRGKRSGKNCVVWN